MSNRGPEVWRRRGFCRFYQGCRIAEPRSGTKSRVYYKGLPKKFIAGTLYDPAEKEVLIGATCTLVDEESGLKFTETTTGFGDFWFKELPDDRSYSLTFEKDGVTQTMKAIKTDIDRGLGDIAMNMAVK